MAERESLRILQYRHWGLNKRSLRLKDLKTDVASWHWWVPRTNQYESRGCTQVGSQQPATSGAGSSPSLSQHSRRHTVLCCVVLCFEWEVGTPLEYTRLPTAFWLILHIPQCSSLFCCLTTLQTSQCSEQKSISFTHYLSYRFVEYSQIETHTAEFYVPFVRMWNSAPRTKARTKSEGVREQGAEGTTDPTAMKWQETGENFTASRTFICTQQILLGW